MKKKGGHAVAAQNIGDQNQKRGGSFRTDGHTAYVDGNDPQHTDAPQIIKYGIALSHENLQAYSRCLQTRQNQEIYANLIIISISGKKNKRFFWFLTEYFLFR